MVSISLCAVFRCRRKAAGRWAFTWNTTKTHCLESDWMTPFFALIQLPLRKDSGEKVLFLFIKSSVSYFPVSLKPKYPGIH